MSGDIVEIPDFKSEKRIYDIFGKNRYAKVTYNKGVGYGWVYYRHNN